MIMEGGPVETAFTVYSDFEDYAGGIYHHGTSRRTRGSSFVLAARARAWRALTLFAPVSLVRAVTGTMAGGHAVKMVGWGEEGGKKYWKVANSWNPYWGEKGYFRIVKGSNEGGIENQGIGSAAGATWGKKSVLDRQ